MFTGIIEALGTVVALERQGDSGVLRVRAGELVEDLPQGGSLAVNGICLTAVTEDGSGEFAADVMGETLARTGLAQLVPGDRVNLERCLPVGGRFDGHIVQGHVDGTGTVVAVTAHPSWTTLRIGLPAVLAPQLAEKGSIAVDGISLTVTAVSPAEEPEPWFEVGVIPSTLAKTTLGSVSVGQTVNLETDAVAKYLLRARQFEAEPVAGSGFCGTRQEAEHGPRQANGLDPVQRAVAEVAAGSLVVVVDDEDRENEGDLVGAASLATAEQVAFMVRHTSGVVCAPMPGEVADQLALPPMVSENQDPKGTAYTVTCDAATGVSTGISAADRARTLAVLAGAESLPSDLTRPGHVLPLRAVRGGVSQRPGHTEAAVELARQAGQRPVGYIAELVHEDGSMMRFAALRAFADQHGLAMVSIADLRAHLAGADD